MLPEKKKASINFLILGFVVSLIGNIMIQTATFPIIGYIAAIVGTVVFIWGCVYFAQAKGYPGILGLLGLLSCLGLIVLLVLPDKTATPRA